MSPHLLPTYHLAVPRAIYCRRLRTGSQHYLSTAKHLLNIYSSVVLFSLVRARKIFKPKRMFALHLAASLPASALPHLPLIQDTPSYAYLFNTYFVYTAVVLTDRTVGVTHAAQSQAAAGWLFRFDLERLFFLSCSTSVATLHVQRAWTPPFLA